MAIAAGLATTFITILPCPDRFAMSVVENSFVCGFFSAARTRVPPYSICSVESFGIRQSAILKTDPAGRGESEGLNPCRNSAEAGGLDVLTMSWISSAVHLLVV